MKLATKAVAGLAKTSCAEFDLLDHAVTHDCNPVRHRQGLELIVGDDHSGLGEASQHPLDIAAHGLAQFDIKATQGFVEQKTVGLAHHRARDGDALLLPLRDLVRHPVKDRFQLQHPRHPRNTPGGGLRVEPLDMQREHDVVAHGQRRIEGVELEHHCDVTLVGPQVVHALAGYDNIASTRALEAGDNAQSRGLAATGRAQKADDLAGRHREAQVFDRGERAEMLGDVPEIDRRHRRYLLTVPNVTPRNNWFCSANVTMMTGMRNRVSMAAS